MKVLMFSPFFWPHVGGLESYVFDMANKLVQTGDEVVVVTANIPKTREEEVIENVKILRYPAFEIINNYPLPNLWDFRFWKIKKMIENENYSVVFSNTRFFLTSLMAFYMAKFLKIKHLHIEHGSGFVESGGSLVRIFAWMVDQTMGRFIFRHSDKNIVISKEVAKFIARFDRREVLLAYRGIDEKSFIFKRKNKKPSKIKIAFVGRLISGKGVMDLIRAIEGIKKFDFSCQIVGDGPEKQKIEAEINRRGLSDKVVLSGQKTHDEVIKILGDNDIFINPSYTEGLPTTVLEAVGCGNIVVATDVGGTKEIIKDYRKGILVEPKNIPKLRQAIIKAGEMAGKDDNNDCNQKILEKFSWDVSIKKIKKYING